jgi:hypothetical protein
MRKLMVATLLWLMALGAAGQQLDTTRVAVPQLDYLKKSRVQKTTAWIVLWAGAAGLFTTLVVDGTEDLVVSIDNAFGGPPKKDKSYAGYYAGSVALMGSSIFLFSAAKHNKQKALEAGAYLKLEEAPKVQGSSLTYKSYPSVGVCVPL